MIGGKERVNSDTIIGRIEPPKPERTRPKNNNHGDTGIVYRTLPRDTNAVMTQKIRRVCRVLSKILPTTIDDMIVERM